MDKKKKTQIILGILFVVAVIVWGGALGSSKGHQTVLIDETSVQETSLSEMVSRLLNINQTQEAVKSTHQDWGRNPFILTPSGDHEMVLQGIIWDPITPQALINDKIVGVGDQIGKMRVINIQSRKVILNDGTKNIELGVGP